MILLIPSRHRLYREGIFMCRRNLIPAAAAIGFGVGMIVSLLFDSSLVRLVVGAAAIGVGYWLLKANR